MRKLKEKCRRGHEYTEANLYRRKNGTRNCKACRRMLNGTGVESPIEDLLYRPEVLRDMVALIDRATQRRLKSVTLR